MALKASRLQIIHGSLARRVILRAFLVVFAMSTFPFLQLFYDINLTKLYADTSDECAVDMGYLNPNSFSGRVLKPVSAYAFPHCKENVNLTVNMVRELMCKQLLNYGAQALCVGEGSALAASALPKLGFSHVYRHPFFSLTRKQLVYELEYKDNSFDFVLTRELDRVSVPALLVLEIERVLRPGGVGAMLVGIGGSNSGSLIRSATRVSSFLKTSDIVHVGNMSSFTLIVFKKRFHNVGYFERYRLPADCPSIRNNKPYIEYMEPLQEEKPMGLDRRVSYLPKFIDVSSRKLLVSIDIGVGELVNSSVTNWFPPFYPVDSQAFNVYVVDHDTSVLLYYVKRPGITFGYHPGLAGNRAAANLNTIGDLNLSLDDEGFDFLVWFKETVEYADFVVLKMNAGRVRIETAL